MQKGKILVVDDLPDVRNTISGLLTDAGFDVKSVTDKNEALHVLNAEKFNVAILDIRLDEADEDNKDGLLLMHEIKKQYPSIVIIILTGYADVKMVREALQPDHDGNSPAFGFLEKTEIVHLTEYIERAFDHTTQKSVSSISNLIDQGENEHVEFKSSVRWDYKTKSTDKSIKQIIAKTMTGFLNGKGGILLIGVADDGKVVGIEKDLETLPKKNRDEFQIALTEIVSNYLGVEHLPQIHPRFETVNSKLICIISIDKSPIPVFLKGDDNKLWVRAGNSTRYLGVKAAMSYIESNWKK